jgi:hypothetical protein
MSTSCDVSARNPRCGCIPDWVIADAKGRFGRRARGNVAYLVFDSLLDAGAPAEAHQLRFEHPRLWINLQVSVRATQAALTGTLDPVTTSRAVLYLEDRTFIAPVENGAFSFDPVAHGLARVSFRGEAGQGTIWSDWFRI